MDRLVAASRGFHLAGQVRFELTMSCDGGLKARCPDRAGLLALMRAQGIEP